MQVTHGLGTIGLLASFLVAAAPSEEWRKKLLASEAF